MRVEVSILYNRTPAFGGIFQRLLKRVVGPRDPEGYGRDRPRRGDGEAASDEEQL